MESAKGPRYAVLGNAESFMEFDLSDRIGKIRCPAWSFTQDPPPLHLD